MPDELHAGLQQILTLSLPLAALALLLLLAWQIAHRSQRPFATSATVLRKLAKYPFVPPLLVFLVALGNGLLLTRVAGVPLARVHDEFSYLLAGDTFAHGRMTNPTPAMWRSFETMHEIFQPTYTSKYQPLPGVTLALGQVLFDGPWVGSVLITAIGCAALTWALRAWVRPKWALLAGLLVSVHPQSMQWGHSYWGGGLGMTGGSLIFGALGRIERSRRGLVFWSILLALGGVIVGGTRPYEAFIWGVLAGLTLLILFIRQHAALRKNLLHIVIPIVCVLIPAGALQAYYNWRVTGKPQLIPYVLHSQQYNSVPIMLWQELPPKKYITNEQLRQQYDVFDHDFFMQARGSLKGYLIVSAKKAYGFMLWHLLNDLPLLLGLLAMPFALGRTRLLWLALAYGIVAFVSYAITPYLNSHYIGPYMPVMFTMAMRGLQRVKLWRPFGRSVGRALVGLCFLTCLPMVAYTNYIENQYNHEGSSFDRYNIEQKLSTESPDDLVFVNYHADHNLFDEWVFNGADIDSQKVIWARHLSPAEDRELAEHYPNRRVWIVYADETPPRLEPFSPTTQSSERSSGNASTNPTSGN